MQYKYNSQQMALFFNWMCMYLTTSVIWDIYWISLKMCSNLSMSMTIDCYQWWAIYTYENRFDFTESKIQIWKTCCLAWITHPHMKCNVGCFLWKVSRSNYFTKIIRFNAFLCAITPKVMSASKDPKQLIAEKRISVKLWTG